jgi:hypothetical protein
MDNSNKIYQSRFAVKDEVWIMRNDRPQAFRVGIVNIKASEGGLPGKIHISINYSIRIEEGDKFVEWIDVNENKCFATKDHLLASF